MSASVEKLSGSGGDIAAGTINNHPTKPSRTSLAQSATLISSGYVDQMYVTLLAIKDRLIHARRNVRQSYLDIKDMYKDALDEEKGRKMIYSALLDDSVLRETYVEDRIELQEVYFGISILMLALTVGGILGNIWTEIGWAPQLGVFHALFLIFFFLFRIWVVLKEYPVDPKEKIHRSGLYLTLLAVGFSLGCLCTYSLILTAPRLLCPLTLAFLIDTKIRFYPPIFRGNRLEFFMVITLLVNILCWMLLFVLGQMSFLRFFCSIIMNGIKLAFLFGHFQMLYFAHCTLLKRENNQVATNDTNDNPAEKQMDINLWDSSAHFLYVLAAVALDLLIACMHG